jgi:putative oligomerization/nucleic acid binding protein
MMTLIEFFCAGLALGLFQAPKSVPKPPKREHPKKRWPLNLGLGVCLVLVCLMLWANDPRSLNVYLAFIFACGLFSLAGGAGFGCGFGCRLLAQRAYAKWKGSRVRAKDESTKPKDTYTELLKLDDLHKRGILTDAEFEGQKKRLLEGQ